MSEILLRIPRETQGRSDEEQCILHLAAFARRWAHDRSVQLSLVPLLQTVGKLQVEYLLQIKEDKVKGDQHDTFAFLDIILVSAQKALPSLLDSEVRRVKFPNFVWNIEAIYTCCDADGRRVPVLSKSLFVGS